MRRLTSAPLEGRWGTGASKQLRSILRTKIVHTQNHYVHGVRTVLTTLALWLVTLQATTMAAKGSHSKGAYVLLLLLSTVLALVLRFGVQPPAIRGENLCETNDCEGNFAVYR